MVLLGTEPVVPVSSLVSTVAEAALSAGMRLGMSWQQGDGSQAGPAQGTGRPGSAGGGPGSRLGAAAAGAAKAQGGVISVASLQELGQVLKLLAQPSAQRHPSRSGSGTTTTSSRAAAGAQLSGAAWVTTLHVHNPSSGTLGVLHIVAPPPEWEGGLLKLLAEVIGLHRHRPAGERLAWPYACLPRHAKEVPATRPAASHALK